MRGITFGLVIAAPFVFAAVPGHAADKLSAQDRSFVHDAAQGGLAEVQEGKLAQQKASSADVKQFANTMVTDHTKANDELKRIAQEKGVTAPARTSEQEATAEANLRKESGTQFDRDYIKQQIGDHQKTIALFEKQVNSGSDPDLKSFAQETLPILRRHLEMAQGLSSKT